jgi:tRNA U34 5-methylaminomethyl-2-thiouridine-forming methyltransferase MnmC
MADPVSILEVGFGTGLNVLLTAIRCRSIKRTVNYVTLEKYPLEESILSTINHHEFAGEEGQKIFELIHSSQWSTRVKIFENFYLTKLKMDFTLGEPEGIFDLIYFDAFGPDKQPEMWSEKIFSGIGRVTGKNGVFVTYSAKGQVKRNLRSAGFDVSLLPGPPGKRQMIRAIKT